MHAGALAAPRNAHKFIARRAALAATKAMPTRFYSAGLQKFKVVSVKSCFMTAFHAYLEILTRNASTLHCRRENACE